MVIRASRLLDRACFAHHAASRLFERLHLPSSIKAEQVLRLNENKDFSYAEAQRDFGFNPLAFEEGIGNEIKQIGLNNLKN